MHFLESVGVIFVAFCVLEHDAAATEKSSIQTKLFTTGLECMKDFPLETDDLKAFTSKVIPEGENAKCFLNCVYKHLGILDDEGKISEKKAKKTAKHFFKNDEDTLKKVDELIQKCMHVNDEDVSGDEKGCQRAFLATKCYMEHAIEIGLDIPSLN